MKNIFVLVMLLASVIIVSCNKADSPSTEQAQPTSTLRIVVTATDLSTGYNRLTFALIDSKTGPLKSTSLQAHTFPVGKDVKDRPKKDLDVVYREWPES